MQTITLTGHQIKNLTTSQNVIAIAAIGFLTALFSGLLLILFNFDISDALLNGLVIPALLLGFHYRHQLTAVWLKIFTSFVLGVALAYGIRVGWLVVRNIINPPAWDFQLYWIYGLAGAKGLNPYLSENLRQLGMQFNIAPELLSELYFFQFPQTQLLFAPLGWFDIHTAVALWYLLHLVIFGSVIFLLSKTFLKNSGLLGLLVTTALLLSLQGTRETIYHTQVNFLVLLMLILFWRNPKTTKGGVWLTIGLIVKPVLFAFPLYLLLKQRWRVITSIIVTSIGISLLTIVVFGPTMFFSYFVSNPIANDMPDYLYVEGMNQSLLATVLRLTEYDIATSSPYTQPVFVTLGLVIAAITGWIVWKLDEQSTDFGLAIATSFTLLIFPKTLTHYSVLFMVTFLLLWLNRREFWGGVWGVVFFITAEYALIALSGNYVFVAMGLNWCVMATIGAWKISEQIQEEKERRVRLPGSIPG